MKEEFVTFAKFVETRCPDNSTDETLRKEYVYYLLGHFYPKVSNLTYKDFKEMFFEKFKEFLVDVDPLSDQEYLNLYCEFIKPEFVTFDRFIKIGCSDYSTDQTLRESYLYYLLGYFYPKLSKLISYKNFKKMFSRKFEGFLLDVAPLSDQAYQDLYCKFMKHD